MRILILGATGRSGGLAVTEALARGHTVTALVRNPSAMKAQKNVTVIEGQPLSTADMDKAFTSAPPNDPIKGIISTLGNVRAGDSPWAKQVSSPTFLADSLNKLLAAMRTHNAAKIVILSTTGIGASTQYYPWLMSTVVKYSGLKVAFDDHEAMEQILRKEKTKKDPINFVDVKAVSLNDKEKKPVRTCGEDGKGAGWFISRESCATFMLDVLEGSEWDYKLPVITN